MSEQHRHVMDIFSIAKEMQAEINAAGLGAPAPTLDALREQVAALQAENAALLNALCDMVARACWTDTGELDHMCSGTYEGALDLLERLGKVESLGGRVYRWVVAQPRERSVTGTVAGRETLPDLVIDDDDE